MGFLDMKAICGVCGNQVGLNRFKVNKSDAWICPGCLKKAGGPMKINVGKVTIEEIKEIITQIEEKENHLSDLRLNNPMKTAEGMYNYCVKNGYGSGWNEDWGVKHFKVIEKSLMNGEEVLMTFIGLHNYQSMTEHDQNFAYAITNKRFIMAQKNMVAGEKLQTVVLDNINDITFVSSVLLGVMTIDTIKEVFNVGLDKNSAEKINAKVLEVLDTQKTAKMKNAQSANSTVSAADELKKFKELLDSGVLNQEEFNAKKKQLLGL